MASLTWHSVLRRRTLAFVGDELIWDAESADHLRSDMIAIRAGRRSKRSGRRRRSGDLHGINAWPATGADLTFYLEGVNDGEDD